MYNPTFFDLALDHQRELVGDVEHDLQLSEARFYARQHAPRPTLAPRTWGVRDVWKRWFAASRGELVVR